MVILLFQNEYMQIIGFDRSSRSCRNYTEQPKFKNFFNFVFLLYMPAGA